VLGHLVGRTGADTVQGGGELPVADDEDGAQLIVIPQMGSVKVLRIAVPFDQPGIHKEPKPILLFSYWTLALCWVLSAFPVQANLRIHGLKAIDPSVVRVEPQPLKRTSRPEIRRLHVCLRNVSSAPFPKDTILLAFEIKAPEGILVDNAHAVSVEGIPYFELDTSDFGPGRAIKIRVELVNEIQRQLLEQRQRPPG